jgi:hypothetical protein
VRAAQHSAWQHAVTEWLARQAQHVHVKQVMQLSMQ